MDKFSVVSKDVNTLSSSHLVEELKESIESGDNYFPVLIGRNVTYFHDIDGGYVRDEGYHVVKLIHRIQGKGTPPNETFSKNVEIHTDDSAFFLEVEGSYPLGDYPNEDYELCLKVTGYSEEPFTFKGPLMDDIDSRETEFDYEQN